MKLCVSLGKVLGYLSYYFDFNEHLVLQLFTYKFGNLNLYNDKFSWHYTDKREREIEREKERKREKEKETTEIVKERKI